MSDETTNAAGVPLWLERVSVVTMCLSTFMLSYLLSEGTSYVVLLICLFLWFVAGMHCGLCLWKGIRKRHIRYGEYTYLLLAIVGVLLASASAGGDRLQVIVNAKAQIQMTQNGVTNILSRNETVCNEELYQWVSRRTEWLSRVGVELGWLIRVMYVPSKEFCAWNAEVSRLLRSSQPSEGDLSEIIGNGYKLAHDHGWYNLNPKAILFNILTNGNEEYLGPVTMLAIEAYMLRRCPAYSTEAMGELQKQSHNLLWNAINNFVWPIVLCLAISIRLTKVTSDFFDWPR